MGCSDTNSDQNSHGVNVNEQNLMTMATTTSLGCNRNKSKSIRWAYILQPVKRPISLIII